VVDRAGLAGGGNAGIAQHHTNRVVDRLKGHSDRPAIVERHPGRAEHEQFDMLGPFAAHGSFLGLQSGRLDAYQQVAGVKAVEAGATLGVGSGGDHGAIAALGGHPSLRDRPTVERRDIDR
jgi:hypothetical protein